MPNYKLLHDEMQEELADLLRKQGWVCYGPCNSDGEVVKANNELVNMYPEYNWKYSYFEEGVRRWVRFDAESTSDFHVCFRRSGFTKEMAIDHFKQLFS